jgi:hypothetical protein
MLLFNNYPLGGGAIHVAYSTSATAKARQQALRPVWGDVWVRGCVWGGGVSVCRGGGVLEGVLGLEFLHFGEATRVQGRGCHPCGLLHQCHCQLQGITAGTETGERFCVWGLCRGGCRV